MWFSLVAAALAIGVLFGHELDTHGALRAEGRSDAVTEAPRAQDPQPVLEAPLAPSRSGKESASTSTTVPK